MKRANCPIVILANIQIYLNTLAVYAVHSYLKWLSVETALIQSDSWHPGLRAIFDVADLVLPRLSFSQSSRPVLSSEYDIAASRGVKLKQVPVAIDELAIAVHPSLNIEGLTLDQLKEIYTGQITNWNQVGGPNLKITPYSRSIDDSGTTEFFKRTF